MRPVSLEIPLRLGPRNWGQAGVAVEVAGAFFESLCTALTSTIVKRQTTATVVRARQADSDMVTPNAFASFGAFVVLTCLVLAIRLAVYFVCFAAIVNR